MDCSVLGLVNPAYPGARPARARIDLGALRHNHGIVRRYSQNAFVWSVVKANAYGHGLLQVVGALAQCTDGFALLELEAAIALREAGFQHPILLLEGFFEPEGLHQHVQYDLTPVVHCMEQVQMLQRSAARPRHVFVKFNTGMNRLGFRPVQAEIVLAQLQNMGITGITLMTHFADADDTGRILGQIEAFRQIAAFKTSPCCLANSAALVRVPAARGDSVRPGILLYGASPFSGVSALELGLQPVMTLESQIIGIQELKAGERVGYDGVFQASAPMRIGIVACGYADGYPRHAPTGTPIAVAGQASRTLGRVSMDMLACDLTSIPEAVLGSPVTLWGAGQGGVVAADEVAQAAGTISYELFCALAPRIPVNWVGAD